MENRRKDVLQTLDNITVAEHLINIFSDGELEENSVCRKYRRTGADGKKYNSKFYNLESSNCEIVSLRSNRDCAG